ncbi:uncharacterized protein LY89DRAFT_734961 [Mollisia scopiformis]|uniref:BZIP domain-containing protein n=1 Tax=Mollisia scopiformis TaxID=149040 RepID=A0A194X6J8_MOLSC|nr:uncharacterized protein LY89DRAFT_734961 [Mollisia scopiformis]KUJ15811.1 hypothetical protein LY89DRAFT_734961 [Mollisia scopiformis]
MPENSVGTMDGQDDTTRSTNKPRGRPRKDIIDTGIELRRAKTRRAQTTFRARQRQHLNKLEQKCRRLEDVVEQMTTAVLDFSDDLDQSNNLDPNAGENLRTAMTKFVALSKTGSGDPNELQQDPRIFAKIDRRTFKQPSTEAKRAAITAMPTPPTNRPSKADLRMNHNIWNRHTESSNSASSAIPYILAGRDSFASRLYYETIALVLRSMYGELPGAIAGRMFRFKSRYCTCAKIRGILGSVFNMLLHGTFQSEDVNTDITDDKAVKALIVHQIESSGGSEHDYLSTWEVERYLKKKWRLGIDSNTVKVQASALLSINNKTSQHAAVSDGSPKLVFPTMVPGFPETSPSMWNVESLLERLKLTSVSIGEGPRWHIADIDAAVEAFLTESKEDDK